MSIDLERQIIEAGQIPQDFVTTPYWTGSVRFVASEVRTAGFRVGSHPIDGNPHHGEIWGVSTKTHQKLLQSMAVWFVPIPGVRVVATP
jgi:hypothetical protein